MDFKINKFFIDDIENENHPSVFETADEYSILVARLPFIKRDGVDVISYAFLIKDRVYIYDRSKSDFEQLGDFVELYQFLDISMDKILEKISTLDIEIAEIEDKLYDGNLDKVFVNRWLTLKKELVLIERYIDNFMVSFKRFTRYYKDKIDQLAYKDLEEHINRALRYSRNAIKKLDYLYSFYTAKMSEKMNSIIFFLTVISGIFMPLTLISGFFGMNTGGLPFEHDPVGTLKAVAVFMIFEIPFILILRQLIKRK